jgi:cytochrome c oxidase assembly protein subunit 15
VLAVEEAGMLDDTSARRDPARAAAGVERLAPGFALLAAITWALIVLGALVRAHGAGLACPDWPLCFGEFVPAFDLKVAFEYSHRLLAGSVTLFFAGLSVAAWRRTRAGDPIRRRIALGAALLALQILLGALTVWHLLAYWTVTSHLLVGNSIAATFAWIALDLHRRHRPAVPDAAPRERRALAAVLALLVLQLALGGLVSSRYAGLTCPEWPTCNGGVWFPTWGGLVGLHLLHRTNGYLLLAAFVALAWICRESPRLARWSRAALALAAAQVLVGIANVLWKIPVELTGLHSALAAALVLCATGAAQAAFAKPCARGN